MIQLIIFDFDGTLFDTREDIADAVNFARQRFGLPLLDLETVTAMVGEGVSVLARRSFAGSPVDPESARAAIMDYYSANPARKARLYPGVRETLPQIHATLTIVSNKPEELVRAILERTRMSSLFDFVAGGDTFEEKKPDPVAVEFLLKKYGLARSEILVVGDHFPDVEMARRAGVRSVYCNYGFFGRDHLGADFQIDRFSDILEVLNGVT